jgi:hypothetical protein
MMLACGIVQEGKVMRLFDFKLSTTSQIRKLRMETCHCFISSAHVFGSNHEQQPCNAAYVPGRRLRTRDSSLTVATCCNRGRHAATNRSPVNTLLRHTGGGCKGLQQPGAQQPGVIH